MKQTDIERFWKLVDVKGAGDCWEFNGTWHGNSPHGRFFFNSKRVGAHRFSYEMHHGPIPEGMLICHRCDNPKCVNPAHLFLGTYADNMRDAFNKGRLKPPPCSPGTSNGMARLTEQDVREIRSLWPGLKQKEIADRFGVDHTTISLILLRKRWRHVV